MESRVDTPSGSLPRLRPNRYHPPRSPSAGGMTGRSWSLALGERSSVLFSVMLPTYEPDMRLAQAIRSVLSQDLGSGRMEIVVVDDGSRESDVASIVRSADAGERVRLVRHADRLGLAGNWNRAVDASSGRLVHLLHQDDYVLPGFYARMATAFDRASGIGMAFCRSRIVDGEGRRLKTSSRLRWLPGVIDGWPETIVERQRVQTPSAVVARTTYEAVGPYRSDLCHTLDWEMWVRIGTRFPVWHDPCPLAAYRRHAGNESSRLFTKGAVWPDIVRAIRINAERFPEADRQALMRKSARWHLGSMIRTAVRQLRDDRIADAYTTLTVLPEMITLLADRDEAMGIERRLLQLNRRIDTLSAAA